MDQIKTGCLIILLPSDQKATLYKSDNCGFSISLDYSVFWLFITFHRGLLSVDNKKVHQLIFFFFFETRGPN